MTVCTRMAQRQDSYRPSRAFIGTAVKRAFGTVSPVVERMWIVVDSVTPEGHLLGRLLNTPVAACGSQRGDQVLVPLALIEERQDVPPRPRQAVAREEG